MLLEQQHVASAQCDLSIIIVAYNVIDLVDTCLSHVQQSKDTLNKEIIFVDNGSTDGTVDLIKDKYPHVKLIESPKNLGFIPANNIAIDEATGKYILMLNSDAFLEDNTLEILTKFMEETKDCGVVGCRAINKEGILLPSARYFPTPWRIFLTKMGLAEKTDLWKNINCMKQSHDEIKECDWVTGCCLLVRKDIIDQMGFFLRPELFMYNDDNDLCLRVKNAGWKVYFHPETITHLSGANNDKISVTEKDKERSARLNIESEYIYFRKNYNLLTVLTHLSLINLFDVIQILKRIILFKKHISIKEHINHMKLSFQLLIKTNFGNRSVNQSD
jgi:N-acetylglucosaminyl-diphospho-decaprenol L-rhamnosyltransferase